jgi:outer membrane protein
MTFATIFNTLAGSQIEVGSFNHESRGVVQYQGEELDTQKDLQWSRTNDMFAKAYLKHPFPLIPKVRMGYTKFYHVGAGKVDGTLHFGSSGFSSAIDTTLDLKMYDLTLYYEVLDNWIDADVGLNIKQIEGTVMLQSSEGYESKDFDLSVPMLYARVGVDIPSTNLSVHAEGNYVTLNGKNIYDAEAGVRYTFNSGLGLETGYKVMHLKFENEDELTMESDFSGAYGKLVLGF